MTRFPRSLSLLSIRRQNGPRPEANCCMSGGRPGLCRIAGLLLTTWLTLQTAWAQESRATVLGRVTDSSGSVIPAATVEISNLNTGVTVKTRTNDEGNYFSSFLNPGIYRITAVKEGFKRTVRNAVTLSVGGRVELNMALDIGVLTEAVTVSADVSLLEPDRPHRFELEIPAVKAGQFRGVFFENVETEYTTVIVPPPRT